MLLKISKGGDHMKKKLSIFFGLGIFTALAVKNKSQI